MQLNCFVKKNVHIEGISNEPVLYINRVSGSSIFVPNGCHMYASEKFSPRLGIEMPVIIIQFFNITKRAHLCCIHLVYYAPEFIMLGSEYTRV